MKYQDSDGPTNKQELIDALELLIQGVKIGSITGWAAVIATQNGRYMTDVSGSCNKHLTHTRGMVATLSDELGVLIHTRGPEDTR